MVDDDVVEKIIYGAIVLILGVVLLVCGIPVHDTVAIKKFGWTYDICIEELRTVEEEGWYLPIGGREKDHYRKFKGTHQEVIGHHDDGTPIYHTVNDYGTWYVYDIDKWFEHYHVTTTALDKNPYWGEYELEDKERVGKKTQEYAIYTVEDGEEMTKWTADYDIWSKAEIGSTIRIKHFRFGKEILKMEVK